MLDKYVHEFCLVLLGDLTGWGLEGGVRSYMGKHRGCRGGGDGDQSSNNNGGGKSQSPNNNGGEKSQSPNNNGGKKSPPRRNRKRASIFRGMRRCMFVSCFPVMQCFGVDECRHHHRHDHPKHFSGF